MILITISISTKASINTSNTQEDPKNNSKTLVSDLDYIDYEINFMGTFTQVGGNPSTGVVSFNCLDPKDIRCITIYIRVMEVGDYIVACFYPEPGSTITLPEGTYELTYFCNDTFDEQGNQIFTVKVK